MISIQPALPGPTPGLLHHHGGFLWWYAELVNEDGDGAVLIWSYGLPFLPGLAQAARDGNAGAIGERPSLNLAIYRRGELDGYWLQEFAPDDVAWDGSDHWRFGQSTLRVRRVQGQIELQAELSLALRAGPPLDGTLRLRGVAASAAVYGDDARHVWTPLMGPGRGELDLRCGDASWQLEAPAYFDRNHGTAMLHELGIGTWLWAHGVGADEQRVAYVLLPDGDGSPEAFGVRIDAAGRTTVVEGLRAELGAARTTRFGMPEWPCWSVCDAAGEWLRVEAQHRIELGPFYLRHACSTTGADGVVRPGMAEVIRPDRIDLGRHRPLVQMRVGRPDRDSMWRPLFTGPRSGRVGRLLRSWAGAA